MKYGAMIPGKIRFDNDRFFFVSWIISPCFLRFNGNLSGTIKRLDYMDFLSFLSGCAESAPLLGLLSGAEGGRSPLQAVGSLQRLLSLQTAGALRCRQWVPCGGCSGCRGRALSAAGSGLLAEAALAAEGGRSPLQAVGSLWRLLWLQL